MKCHGSLVNHNAPSELKVYTRDGTKFAKHKGKKCSNHFCWTYYYFGYSTFDGTKVYEKIDSKTDCLVTSNETVFSINFLFESKLHMLHSNATFDIPISKEKISKERDCLMLSFYMACLKFLLEGLTMLHFTRRKIGLMMLFRQILTLWKMDFQKNGQKCILVRLKTVILSWLVMEEPR